MYKYFFILFLFQKTILASDIITGLIVDSQNQIPIEGVNVTSGEFGTTTNAKGNFKIKVSSDSLNISHIGYISVNVKAEENIIVKLISEVLSSDEIVVTSSLINSFRFEEPSSLSTLSGKYIKKHNYEHFQQITDYIPNLNYASGTSRPRFFQIRGVGERSQYFGEGSPNYSVSYEFDGIDLSGIGMIGSTIDIAHIEVAKGPQSTVFGNNAIAGAIVLKSAEPVNKRILKANFGFGSDNYKSVGVTANFNIFKTLLFRLNINKNYQNGFRKNEYLNRNDTNEKDEEFYRLKMNYLFSDNIVLKNTFFISKMKNGYDAWAPDNNQDFKTYTDQPGEDSQITAALSSRLLINFEDFSTMFKVSSSKSELVHSYDGDWGNNAFWEDSSTFDFDSYYYGYYLPYQYYDRTNRLRKNTIYETRIYNRNSAFGFYIKNLDEDDEAEGYLFGGEGDVARATSNYSIKINAFYGQSKASLNEIIDVANSVRYEISEIDYDGYSFGYANDSLPAINVTKIFASPSFKSSLTFNVNQNLKLYTQMSYGFKAGGVNQQPYVSTGNRFYNPEYSSSIELGFKFKTSKTFVGFSYFYNDMVDKQISISAQQNENNPNSFYFFTSNNNGMGYSKGAEFDFKSKISKNLYLKTSAGYLDTWLTKFSYNISNNDILYGGGRESAMAPKLTSSISIIYDDNLFLASLSQSFKDKYYFSDSHDMMAESYSLTNFSIGRNFGLIKVNFWIRNLFDKRYAVRGFYFGLLPPNYEDQLWKSYGDPQHYGISIEYEFIGPN